MDVPVFIGTSPAAQLLTSELELAAQCDAKVLITGPSGVGKELVARMLHIRSRRHARSFVPLNCAALPDALLESELFGHERGSFTDAHRDKRGLLEVANGGTAFLDEVGEMSLRMQALLLRFLENGEIQRVGSERGGSVSDVRVIAATNRKLTDRISTGEFREDLFYRLNVIHLSIPALRERREDIAPLVRHYLRLFSERQGTAIPHLTVEALRLLERYDWPGNVRELRNVMERLCARPITVITAASLPPEIINPVREVTAPAAAAPARGAAVAETLLRRILKDGESFWDVAYSPFMTRDLTRDDMRQLILTGLQQTRGSYKALVRAFNLDARDYRRFLNFLRKYDCHMPFQRFRALPPKIEADEPRAATGR
jgi:two-component system response regulator AtoC